MKSFAFVKVYRLGHQPVIWGGKLEYLTDCFSYYLNRAHHINRSIPNQAFKTTRGLVSALNRSATLLQAGVKFEASDRREFIQNGGKLELNFEGQEVGTVDCLEY